MKDAGEERSVSKTLPSPKLHVRENGNRLKNLLPLE
jgi:hypothetical protein